MRSDVLPVTTCSSCAASDGCEHCIAHRQSPPFGNELTSLGDEGRIVDFKLRPWAERLIVIRAGLCDAKEMDLEEENKNIDQLSSLQHRMPHTGEPVFSP